MTNERLAVTKASNHTQSRRQRVRDGGLIGRNRPNCYGTTKTVVTKCVTTSFVTQGYETKLRMAPCSTNTGVLCDKKSDNKAFFISTNTQTPPQSAEKRQPRTENKENSAEKYRRIFCHKDSFSCHKADKVLKYNKGGPSGLPLLSSYLKDRAKTGDHKRQCTPASTTPSRRRRFKI